MLYGVLKNRQDIQRVFLSKNTLSDKTLRLKISPNSLESVRIVFAMSKKLAHKPMRNKQIRRMRVIAAITSQYLQSCDIAVIIRVASASFDELKESYEALIARRRRR